MPQFTRQELYDLVWSEPIKTLAARFAISDVGLAKACKKANIPIPERGYWAKKKAGKSVLNVQLPQRGIGASDTVDVGQHHHHHWAYSHVTLEDPEPVEPVFPDDMPDIAARAKALVGNVTVPRQLDKAHPAIAKLLGADAARIKALSASSYSWDKPLFETPFEKRRLRVLNTLFLSFLRAGAKLSVTGKEGRDIRVLIGSQHISLTLDRLGAKRDYRSHTILSDNGSHILQLGVPKGSHDGDFYFMWKDEPGNPLETQLTAAIAELIVEGERRCRENAIRRYHWILERRQALREEIKQKQEAVLRANEERRLQREKERVRGLLRQAHEFRKASDIRTFVKTIQASESNRTVDPTPLAQWMSWASAEADKIDPTKNGELIAHMMDTQRDVELLTEASFEEDEDDLEFD